MISADSHREFMDLLLEKRCNLDTIVTKKERERRANGDSSSDVTDKRHVRKGGREGGRVGEIHVHVQCR